MCPKRGELAALYARILDAAKGKRVVFRTLDIGSDKVLPYMKRVEEPNPAMGWRAIRVGLDKPGVMRMQLQALIRGAKGRPLTVMFPFVAEFDEFRDARQMLLDEVESERRLGHQLPTILEVGAMLETPSLAFAPDAFFEMADFISVGGNDLKQFFFAADRENERVRKRYDMLNTSYATFIEKIVGRCERGGYAAVFLRRGCRAAGRGAVSGGAGHEEPVDAACLHRAGEASDPPRAAGGIARGDRGGACGGRGEPAPGGDGLAVAAGCLRAGSGRLGPSGRLRFARFFRKEDGQAFAILVLEYTVGQGQPLDPVKAECAEILPKFAPARDHPPLCHIPDG